MIGLHKIITLFSFLWIIGPAFAASLYRMDFKTPEEVYAAGGLMSKNPSGTATVMEHVRAQNGDQDPWVSTTNDKKLARAGATSSGYAYVYKIDPSNLKGQIVDTAKEFNKHGEEHPHPGEKEFSVHGWVPWADIISWDTFYRGKLAGTTTREQFEASLSHGSSSHHAGSSSNHGGSPHHG